MANNPIEFFKSMFTTSIGRIFLASAGAMVAVAVIITLLTNCSKKPFVQPMMISFADALTDTTPCYTTEFGNAISRRGAECPPKQLLDQVEFNYMERFRATPDEIKNNGTVFVPQLIQCGECTQCQASGCTNGRDSVVHAGEGWSRTYMIELGHVVSLHRHGEIDPNHKRPYYP